MAHSSLSTPERFLEVRVHDLVPQPSLSGLCVGYERGAWRCTQLANHIMEWLPEFALTPSEFDTIRGDNAVAQLRRAAKAVYDSKKFQRRGEFGELFLHAAIRQVFSSLPAISKIYYKTATNDTVKGFDAVHVVGPPDELELWLGEAKFYKNIDAAISDVAAELDKHLGTDYLRTEFLLITGKIDPDWPHAAALKKLLSPNTSLDEVFRRVCIPVLLTYDSACVASSTCCDAAYRKSFEAEIRRHLATFSAKGLPTNVRIHLFLLPLKSKKELVAALDQRLKAWQTL